MRGLLSCLACAVVLMSVILVWWPLLCELSLVVALLTIDARLMSRLNKPVASSLLCGVPGIANKARPWSK